ALRPTTALWPTPCSMMDAGMRSTCPCGSARGRAWLTCIVYTFSWITPGFRRRSSPDRAMVARWGSRLASSRPVNSAEATRSESAAPIKDNVIGAIMPSKEALMLKRTAYGMVVAGMLAIGMPVLAQKPANAPANATAQCTDGTFSTAKTEKGACSKHGGVKTWFGPAKDAGKTAGVKGGATTDKGTPKGAGGSSATGKAAGATAATASAATGTPPAGSTGQCTDGTYTRAKTQTGACSKHGGVKTWFAAATPAAAAAGTV